MLNGRQEPGHLDLGGCVVALNLIALCHSGIALGACFVAFDHNDIVSMCQAFAVGAQFSDDSCLTKHLGFESGMAGIIAVCHRIWLYYTFPSCKWKFAGGCAHPSWDFCVVLMIGRMPNLDAFQDIHDLCDGEGVTA